MSEQPNLLEVIARNTVIAMTIAPNQKEDWFNTARQIRTRADTSGNEPMVVLLDAVLKLLMGDKLESITPILTSQYATCWQCIIEGIQIFPQADPVMSAVVAFLNASTWADGKVVVCENKEYLLSEGAEQVFTKLLEQHKDESETVRQLEQHRDVLRLCRDKGIEATFSNALRSQNEELNRILLETSQPISDVRDMPRRIALYRRALSLLPREQDPWLWALVQNELGNSLAQNQSQDRVNSLEEAIKCYLQALDVTTREKMPTEWAETIMNLGNAYVNRVMGDRAQNIEEGIHYFLQALEVRTRSKMPVEWAQTMINLGNAYRKRIREDKAENIEEAIHCYTRALEVLTRERNPELWAIIQHNLGIAYRDRIREDRAENLEQAIHYFRQVLELRTHEKLPVEWAETMADLGSVYAERIMQDKTENLEEAINCFRQALEVLTRENLPFQWAGIMTKLGSVYAECIMQDKAENLEKAINCFRQALEVLTRENFPFNWADILTKLGSVYAIRIREDRAENLEEAIHCFRQAIEIVTYEGSLTDWAHIMAKLGNVYAGRIMGDRAENLEQAIHCFRQALQVLTYKDFPTDWAIIHSALGETYRNHVSEDRAENLEEAIHCFRQALEVMTREKNPELWADTMMNLGNAFSERIREDRAENLEEAIHCFCQALEVLTREKMPVEWAQTMMNLGNAFRYRIKEDRTENIEKSILCFSQSLEVLTREDFPFLRAVTMMNLGSTYNERILGDRAENIEEAIRCFRQALEIVTYEDFPTDWALTEMLLGNSYKLRIRGKPEENIELAIYHIHKALKVRTREKMPVEWAQTMINLSSAYAERILGDKTKNLEQAISCLSQAIEVMTYDNMPIEWAAAQNNLGAAYSDLPTGNREANLNRAIACFEAALCIQTVEALPAAHRHTSINLGILYFEERCWSKALEIYLSAIAAGNNLLAAAHTEAGRRAEVGETAQLFARASYCLLKLEQPDEALVMLESGKTRLLAEALALSDAGLDVLPDAQREAMLDTRGKVRDLEAEMRLPPDTPARRSDRELADLLREARAGLDTLIGAIREDHPDFVPTGLDLPSILALIPEGGALVAPLVTSQGSAVFIVPHGAKTVTEEHVIRLDDFTDDELNAILTGSEENPGWLLAYITYRFLGGSVSAWQAAIEQFTGELWKKLFEPVHERLHALNIKQVLLMPSGGLQLLPLHAAWHMENGTKRYFIDDYEVIYAPSAYALDVSRRRAAGRGATTAAIAGIDLYADPRVNPLGNAVAEAEVVAGMLKTEPLLDDAATKKAVMSQVVGKAFLHFSCHGAYAWGSDPLDSGLIMHDSIKKEPGTWLTLSEIIGRLNLNSARLVTLSACETGITDVSQSPDEYVGLPAGFLQAGAPAVVGSLWTVDDRSTALLMERFYKNHLEKGMSLPAALREAQLWLRDASAAGGDDKPFENPFYWAAFTFAGAG